MIIVKDRKTEQGTGKQVEMQGTGMDIMGELTVATHAVFKAISTQAGRK